jgi:hypothetical protein
LNLQSRGQRAQTQGPPNRTSSAVTSVPQDCGINRMGNRPPGILPEQEKPRRPQWLTGFSVRTELKDNQTRTSELLEASPAAPLLAETGIGPVTAAVVYTAWSHLGRVRSDAASAALAGVNPIPASSGNTTRHRLNRGGDRRLNSALHMATVVRTVHDPANRAYADHRKAEGKTSREIRRASIDTSPATSTAPPTRSTPPTRPSRAELDRYRRLRFSANTTATPSSGISPGSSRSCPGSHCRTS